MAPDPNNLKLASEIGRSDVLFCIARQPGSERLLAGSSDARVYAFDLAAEEVEPRQFQSAHSGYVMGAALGADGQLITGAYDGHLVWWDVDQGRPVRQQPAHEKWIRSVIVTPDGQRVVSVADDMACRVWNAGDGQLLLELKGHEPRTPHHFPSMLFCAAVSPDGRLLATGDKTGRAVVWELDSGKRLGSVHAPIMYTWDGKKRIHSIGGIRSLAFSPDSRLLAVGGIGTIGNIDHLGALARVEVFDWQKEERTHEFKGDAHKGLVEHLEFHPEGAWLLAAGGDHGGFIKFFDLEAGKIVKQDKAPMHVHGLVLNESCDKIYAAGHGKLAVWTLS